jgi:hypothetical protein
MLDDELASLVAPAQGDRPAGRLHEMLSAATQGAQGDCEPQAAGPESAGPVAAPAAPVPRAGVRRCPSPTPSSRPCCTASRR